MNDKKLKIKELIKNLGLGYEYRMSDYATSTEQEQQMEKEGLEDLDKAVDEIYELLTPTQSISEVEDTKIKIELMVERAYNLGYDDAESGREVNIEDIKQIENELKSFIQPRNEVIDEVLKILSTYPQYISLPTLHNEIKALKTNESKEIGK